jgi:hypothetical protein
VIIGVSTQDTVDDLGAFVEFAGILGRRAGTMRQGADARE